MSVVHQTTTHDDDDHLNVISLIQPRVVWRGNLPYLKVDDGTFVRIALHQVPVLQREINALAFALQHRFADDPAKGMEYCQALMDNAPEPLEAPGAITVKARADGKVVICFQFARQMPNCVALTRRRTLMVSNALKTAYQQLFL